MGHPARQAILIADLSYGDAGKGSIVDALTRRHPAHTVVRYNGGAQAAHTVVETSGRQHTFAQFGSGTFVSGTRTHLSRFMLVNPLSMLKEEQHLQKLGIEDAFQRASLDEAALIITPFQQAANRLHEIARSDQRHGSCGMGIGETMADFLAYGERVLFARDLPDRATVRHKLRFLREVKLAQLEQIMADVPQTGQAAQEVAILRDPGLIDACADLYQFFSELIALVDDRFLGSLLEHPGTIIFEGAQGVLLDEWYGFHPYTTWSTTTFHHAEQLLQEQAYGDTVINIGVLRGYATRHGAGPLVTEDTTLTALLPDAHNATNPWQQAFRVGHFDLITTRYALALAGSVDALTVTNLDRLAAFPIWNLCDAYHYTGDAADLSSYFEIRDGILTGIKVHRPADLAHQEQLTKLLWHCAPQYQTIQPGHPTDATQRDHLYSYLALLEQHLKRPIAIASYGPTAQDKIYLTSLV